MNKHGQKQSKPRAGSEKQEYESPKLEEYGNLEQLTLTGGSGSNDFLGMQTGMGMN